MKHIVLMGFMGCGKTSVGKRLAKRMNLTFLDTDEIIEEKMQMTVSSIFDTYGEDYFRRLETQIIQELAADPRRHVISLGGGLPVQPQNHVYLHQLGVIIYLTASVDVLVERLRTDTTRPMLQGGDLRQRIVELMERRGPVYRELADLEVDTTRRTFAKIIEKIVEKIE